MLPPVRAISGSDVSFQNQPAPQSQQQPVTAPRLPDQIDTRSNTASIFAKANIRALSSDMHLAQNTISLTETLGKLLNMPRLDGEATQVYSQRLVQAISVLPAPQRAALEQQLGKVLQGLTLAMLVEVMKNPAGPDAARLSVLLEMSRFKGLDMAAKAVVSSYRQNLGAELPTAATPRPAAPIQAQPASAPPAATMATTQAPATAAAPTPAAASTTLPAQAGQTTPNPAAAASQPAAPSPLTEARQAATPPASGLAASDPALPAAAALAAESSEESALAQKPAAPPQTARTADAATTPVSKPQTTTVAPQQPEAVTGKRSAAEPHASAIRHEMPANARDYSTLSARAEARLMSMIAQEQFQGATAKDIENLLLAALTGKLPKRAEIGQPGLPPAFTADDAVDFETKPQTASGQSVHSGTQTESEDAEPLAPRPEAQAASRAIADSKAMMLEQPALHTALAAALAKEGTPLPFVDYPLAKDEPESESQPRGRWPSSGDEAEQDGGDESQGQGGGDQEERAAANDEEENGATDDASQDEPHDSAEAYYLRMGGLA
jgi:hypothetical protein